MLLLEEGKKILIGWEPEVRNPLKGQVFASLVFLLTCPECKIDTKVSTKSEVIFEKGRQVIDIHTFQAKQMEHATVLWKGNCLHPLQLLQADLFDLLEEMGKRLNEKWMRKAIEISSQKARGLRK